MKNTQYANTQKNNNKSNKKNDRKQINIHKKNSSFQ